MEGEGCRHRPRAEAPRGIWTMLSNYSAFGLPDLVFQLRRMYEI